MSAIPPSTGHNRPGAAIDRLGRIARAHPPTVLAASLGAEDMVLVDMIARAGLPIGVFTLDTGRLPEETHALIAQVRRHYGLQVDVFAPAAADVEAHVAAHGPNGFYDSLEARTACCAARKTAPLARALSGKSAWVTGLRREQSVTRRAIAIEEDDRVHGLRKFNPLAEWTRDDVWSYLREHHVPVNTLHARGYASIGCAPCTRPIEAGEDERAGRWWWENPEHKECGLHRRPVGVPVVAAAA